MENKVRVVSALSVTHPLGLMDPRPNMPVQYGSNGTRYIKTFTEDGVVPIAMTEGGTEVGKAYPHDLFILLDDASGTFSYPTGDGSVVFGHGTTKTEVDASPGNSTVNYGLGIPTTV